MNTRNIDAQNAMNITLEKAFAGELVPAQTSWSDRSEVDTQIIR